MHISFKRKKEILTCAEDSCLFAEVLQLALYLSFPCSCGWVLSHTESHLFPCHYCSGLTCLPLLYLTSLVPPPLCDVSPVTPSLNGSSAKKSGEERTLASLLLILKEGLKIQVGCYWWWNYPGVQNFQPFAVATLQKFTLFWMLSSSWASLWTCSCWDSAPFLMCWLLIMQCA